MVRVPSIVICSFLFFLYACGGSSGAPESSQSPPMPQAEMPTSTMRVQSALVQDDARVGACINMGNHLEAPNEGDWGRPINETDFMDIASRGFETVRLPVRFSNHAQTTPPFTLDSDFLARVEEVVDSALAANLRVILDLHHYSDTQGNIFAQPAEQTQRFTEIWRQIAQRFASYNDDSLWFELLNEPHENLTHQNLLDVINPALAAVRDTNPTRPVVIGGENFSNINTLEDLPLPNDAYIIATFHYYDPFLFTHQGAFFINPVPPVGVDFTEADREQLALDVEKAQNFMQNTGIPLFLGEFGAFDTISITDRAEYYQAVSSSFNAIDIDGCPWAYTNTFPMRDPVTNRWFEELLSAIGL